jgi:hypothetical protein
MKNALRAAVVLAVVAVSACTTTQQVADTGFKPPQGDYKMLVMQPEVSVGLLTAGGAVEPREDWTQQGRENVLAALAAHQSTSGGVTTIAGNDAALATDAQVLQDLVRLHKAVGISIQLHKYFPNNGLPTKKDKFDWTLGDQAVALRQSSQHDYALFLYAEDSFASGGRAALQVAGFLTCLAGACVAVSGGQQLAFASLVDLKRGQVVWFNVLASSVGAIRTPDGAKTMVDTLLGQMKAGQAPSTKKKHA